MYNNELDGEMIFTLERWMVDIAGETSQKNLQYPLNIRIINLLNFLFKQNLHKIHTELYLAIKSLCQYCKEEPPTETITHINN